VLGVPFKAALLRSKILLGVTFALAAAPAADQAPSAKPGIANPTASPRHSLLRKYARPTAIPFPLNNAYTKDREFLGKSLFFDPRLSRSRSTSCASCHNPGFSWGDGLPKGIGDGMKELDRRSPTILNAAWDELLFWDGRAETLEEQALCPVSAKDEMNLSIRELLKRISNIPGYAPLFQRAYPSVPIEIAIARAIATFERTVISSQAPFDKWVAGDETAISPAAKNGFDLFNGKARCAQCHSGWNFTDNGFHDVGLRGQDRGRGANLALESMQFAFKTPTLRNADLRSPYTHDGSELTLQSVIAFYDRGGDVKRPSLDPAIVPLHLTPREMNDLEAFLKMLTSIDKPVDIPVLPR